MNKKELLALIEEYGNAMYQVACETGPDRDYRKFAQETADAALAEVVKYLEEHGVVDDEA